MLSCRRTWRAGGEAYVMRISGYGGCAAPPDSARSLCLVASEPAEGRDGRWEIFLMTGSRVSR
jgi:hypothetical protein